MTKIFKDPDNPKERIIQLTQHEIDTTTTTYAPGDLPIIRYMSLDKFLYIISTNSIWFNRVDQFSDEYEGLAVIDQSEVADSFRNSSLVSCWNHFRTESFPLWKIYLGNNSAGIGLVSTVEKFLNSIVDVEEKKFINPLIVKYVDPTEKYDGINNELLISRKKNFYEYEEEIRFNHYKGGKKRPAGMAIEVKPSQLISKIILSPYISKWRRTTIENILNKFELNDVILEDSQIKDKLLL